jgi:hypothetical protein
MSSLVFTSDAIETYVLIFVLASATVDVASVTFDRTSEAQTTSLRPLLMA